MKMRKPKKGSHNKGSGSQQLNELMLRYAQDGQISNVSNCLLKGADVDYANGALCTIAVYIGSSRLLKLVLAHKPTKLKEALDLAEKADDDKLLAMMNDYLKQIGAE
jgi:hypothetical protein